MWFVELTLHGEYEAGFGSFAPVPVSLPTRGPAFSPLASQQQWLRADPGKPSVYWAQVDFLDSEID